ncbi:PIG-L deacetylase family protein [Tundrisphaera sp. TA3]|uniref:PIG-L deacetylase family protein n=1 Tax=Tundrisphaera sp. TA3 TaxID=3435775 RepID=UPI003EB87E96
MSQTTALVISPHLDDAAFSCGGTIASLARQGWRVVLATAFTASVPDPAGFALACQLDKGLGPEVDYMALRRDEDLACGRALGVSEVLWLDLPEAPHRGYGSPAELFGPMRTEDRIAEPLVDAIQSLIGRYEPAVIFAPQGVGGHVDHRQVIAAMQDSALTPACPVAWYRDLPYAARFPDARPDPAVPADQADRLVSLAAEDFAAKLEGCSRYASQVGFQFGGAAEMRRCLSRFAASESERFGMVGSAETLMISDGVDLLKDGGFHLGCVSVHEIMGTATGGGHQQFLP